MGAATAIEWRRVREVVKAVVSSTLTEAMAVAPAVALTQVQGVVRRPVTAKPAPRDAERGAAAPTTSAASRTARAGRCCRRRRAVSRVEAQRSSWSTVMVEVKGAIFSDGDVKTGDGQSRTSEAQAEGRTGPQGWGGPRRRVA